MSRRSDKDSRDDPRRLDDLQQRCREQGLRLTQQRRAVLEALVAFPDHPSADQVYRLVHRRLPGLSRATAFRVLEQLVENGIIGKACHPGRSARYDAITEMHHHLVCLRCEKMVDLFDDDLDAVPIPNLKKTGFKVVDFRVQLRGFCSQCQQQSRKEEHK